MSRRYRYGGRRRVSSNKCQGVTEYKIGVKKIQAREGDAKHSYVDMGAKNPANWPDFF
jgi:hypothetical protein